MPTTVPDGFPFETRNDEAGITLHGGLSGVEPILAEAVQTKITQVEGTVVNVSDSVAALTARFETEGAQVLATIDGGSGTNTTEFSNIPQTLQHLQILWFGRSSGGGEINRLGLRFNGDSSSNYQYGGIRSTSADAVSVISSGGVTTLGAGWVGTGNTSTGLVTIGNYAGGFAKMAVGYFAAQGQGGYTYTGVMSGQRGGTADPITSIRLWPVGETWSGDPHMILIGWPHL